jgi:hypothetical protein
VPLLTLCVNELETVWSLYNDVMLGISYYTVEVGATFGPFGYSVLNYVGMMLRGSLGGLTFVVSVMLNTLGCGMSQLERVGIRKVFLCMP